jgi:hypothetical protein
MSTTAMDRAEPLDDGKPFYKDFSSCQDLNLVLVAFVIVDPLMTTGSEVATATENRLHIYKRPCCTCRCGPRYEPLSRAPFAVRGWARLPPRTVYRVHQLPV